MNINDRIQWLEQKLDDLPSYDGPEADRLRNEIDELLAESQE